MSEVKFRLGYISIVYVSSIDESFQSRPGCVNVTDNGKLYGSAFRKGGDDNDDDDDNRVKRN